MRIKKIQIKNFKSLVDFELENLKPFCAFVGPNASGKSNIFEALEFVNYVANYNFKAPSFFGGKSNIKSFDPLQIKEFPSADIECFFLFDDLITINFDLIFSEKNEEILQSIIRPGFQNKPPNLPITSILNSKDRQDFLKMWERGNFKYENDYEQFIDNFSRIFVGKSELRKINSPSIKLLPDASNVSQMIGQIFEEKFKQEDFIEWLRILIPELHNIEVKQSNIDGSFEFFVYEKSSTKPFPKHLLSDGTKNILSLMAAVYQTDQPQFLCIEEPENGLHPQAIQLMVDFFREKCEEHGHHIWLNTHSQTLVRCLEIDEIILVNKINGETKAKQLSGFNDIDINTDEAWLSNALGGGVL